MIPFRFFLILLSAIGDRFSDALECYNCSNVDNINACVSITQCATLQSCFLEMSSSGYRLGCIDNQHCGAISSASTALVGRALTTDTETEKDEDDEQHSAESTHFNPRSITNRNTEFCFECCSLDVCNKHLCDHPKPSACIDDVKIDCAWMNSRFNVCQNINEAKFICPKFCGLCNLVDGSWAEWSSWSPCDHTCANGTQTRLRNCDSPAPAHGGQQCLGSAVDNKHCFRDPCPVHGGWTQWFSWDPCSVTCDIGVQVRHRNCSNPKPQLFGDHCFGDPLESKICTPGPCANGRWSAWGTWSLCSTSCGGGFQTRSRTCSNPRPSYVGLQCEGDTIQVLDCNNSPCLTPTIAFDCRDLDNLNLTYDSHTLVFTYVTMNVGNGYDNESGIFTAPLSGLYSFNVQLCIAFSGNYGDFGIQKNGVGIKNWYARSGSEASGCYNMDAVVALNQHDRVWVVVRIGSGTLLENDSDYWNTFSGFLIHM